MRYLNYLNSTSTLAYIRIMDSSILNSQRDFINSTIDTTLNSGKKISLFTITLYLLIGLFTKISSFDFQFNILAFSGIIPSILFLILSNTWLKSNKKYVNVFFALSYLGVIFTLSTFLYIIYTDASTTELLKFQLIIFTVIVLIAQSILSFGIRKYIYLMQFTPLLLVFIIISRSIDFKLNDWLFILNIPIVIFFSHIINRFIDKHYFDRFKNTYELEISESNLINETEVRKKAEKELKQYKKQLKQIVEERTNHIKEKNLELEASKLKAEEHDQLKTAFMATMSHELRTPLNAIIGFSELMDEDTSKHEFLEFKDIINKSGMRLLMTVEDIFQLTYIETNVIELSNEKFNLNGFINSLMDNYDEEKENFHKKYLDIKFKPGLEDKNCFVNSDPKRIKTILDKLVHNAIKFTKIGSIEIGYKYALSGEYKDHFIFHVKDTGIGISQEFHEIIFDRFRQVEETNTRNYEGSGLGVTIAKELAKLLGGNMWVESEINKGSTFYFALPIEILGQETHFKAIHYNKNGIPDFSTKRILIAEDTESNFKLLEHYLKKTKVQIIWAVDGVEAIEYCKMGENIDLILMDMKMPNMNGYEATTAIKKLGVKCPVIAQTAYALQDDEVKSFTAGCDDYLSKPIKSRELISCLEKYLMN